MSNNNLASKVIDLQSTEKPVCELPFWYNKFKPQGLVATADNTNSPLPQPPSPPSPIIPTKPTKPIDTTRRNSKGVSLAWIAALNKISATLDANNESHTQTTVHTKETISSRKRINRSSLEREELPRKKPALSTRTPESTATTTAVERGRVLLPSDRPDKAVLSSVQPSSQNAQSTSHADSLSPEQKAIHDLIVDERKNVFFTGAAGTGKSVLLRALIKTLRSKYGKDQVAVTAPTGLAALNIGGITINSFVGVGFGDDTSESYVKKINYTPLKQKELIMTRVLIIDEVSMINGPLLDLVEAVIRLVRRSHKPFGGVQVILSGDFYQLPPVVSKKLAFEAKCWDKVIQEYRMLVTPFRQKDMRFVNMLNELRVGKVSEETTRVFTTLMRPPKIENNIIPTELYPRKNQVHAANLKKLVELKGSPQIFKASDFGDRNLLRNCMAAEELCLKEGAQVMLIKNVSQADKLVNGSLGIVTGFLIDKSSTYPVVKFSNGLERVIRSESWDFSIKGDVVARRSQIPLILAWAISIHKAQGKTIEYVKVDLQQVFEAGQAYTAISRATDLNKLQLLNFNKSLVKIDQRVAEFYKKLKSKVCKSSTSEA